MWSGLESCSPRSLQDLCSPRQERLGAKVGFALVVSRARAAWFWVPGLAVRKDAWAKGPAALRVCTFGCFVGGFAIHMGEPSLPAEEDRAGQGTILLQMPMSAVTVWRQCRCGRRLAFPAAHALTPRRSRGPPGGDGPMANAPLGLSPNQLGVWGRAWRR